MSRTLFLKHYHECQLWNEIKNKGMIVFGKSYFLPANSPLRKTCRVCPADMIVRTGNCPSRKSPGLIVMLLQSVKIQGIKNGEKYFF